MLAPAPLEPAPRRSRRTVSTVSRPPAAEHGAAHLELCARERETSRRSRSIAPLARTLHECIASPRALRSRLSARRNGDRRERIAQLVRERGEELVLAPVGFAQRCGTRRSRSSLQVVLVMARSGWCVRGIGERMQLRPFRLPARRGARQASWAISRLRFRRAVRGRCRTVAQHGPCCADCGTPVRTRSRPRRVVAANAIHVGDVHGGPEVTASSRGAIWWLRLAFRSRPAGQLSRAG